MSFGDKKICGPGAFVAAAPLHAARGRWYNLMYYAGFGLPRLSPLVNPDDLDLQPETVATGQARPWKVTLLPGHCGLEANMESLDPQNIDLDPLPDPPRRSRGCVLQPDKTSGQPAATGSRDHLTAHSLEERNKGNRRAAGAEETFVVQLLHIHPGAGTHLSVCWRYRGSLYYPAPWTALRHTGLTVVLLSERSED
ncbi:hypothetical protein EYF80_020429 [Liparis tanakae]|uniref:Uncharacterized protein n=1 Tax=Liparis tanakae TaxID=230148 RepID=A0A4Z2HU58_9TELE|nr:hypothetical protein EYF80_020429 [Liparis tanakae]